MDVEDAARTYGNFQGRVKGIWTLTTPSANLHRVKILGVLLIALGVAGLVYGGLTYTTREKVLDLGFFEATAEREKRILVPPLVSVGVVAAGVVLLLIPGRRRR